MNYGGGGGKVLRDVELAERCVGNCDTYVYKVTTNNGKIYWVSEESIQLEEEK